MTSSTKRPLLIVNPRSGGGKTGRIFDQMRGPIERSIGAFDAIFTERGRHAVDIARVAAQEGVPIVVAVGGDGSIHEVVNGLMEAREKGAHETRLGIIGQGTGGDLRRTLGVEHRLDRYCDAIAGGKVKKLDIGRITYEDNSGAPASAYFINILSVGIGGLVDRIVANASRGLGGTFAYYSASVRGLIESELGVLGCTIRYKGETREEEITTRNLAVCNGRYFGSGMKVAPMAEPDDGVFEVIDLGKASKLRFAMVSSSRIYTGDHIGHPDVRHFRCDKISMVLKNKSVADKFLLDVDGEPLGKLPLTIELMPGAIEVLVP
ncbi:Transcription regulator [Minicystis rosea]|nr:Transcription regulator [Minicystis rosea]